MVKIRMNNFVSSPRFYAVTWKWIVPVLLLCLSLAATQAQAQSLGYEGPTGIFITPLAMTAASPAKGVGLPSVSYHFLAGGPIIGDFSTVSATVGFFKRFEVGYTREFHIEDGGETLLDPTTNKSVWDSGLDIAHAKVNITPAAWSKVATFSVGGIYRFNDQIGVHINNLAAALLSADNIKPVVTAGQKTANADFYLVGTKIITQVSKQLPIIVSVGGRGTNAALWGLGGNAPGYEGKAFGSVAFVITGPAKSTIILAAEAAGQPQHISSATATATMGASQKATLFDIPTSESYAIRIVPFSKIKLNIDAGLLHAGGYIDNPLLKTLAGGKVNLNMRARPAFAVSYGF
jgi:hypothetical protein